jgi:hypothetical protein
MIPATAHFIWFGPQFPWVNALSMRSAALRGGFEKVVLHHSDDLTGTPWWSWLEDTPGFEARMVTPEAVFARCGARGFALWALFKLLDQPAAKANMIRAAILYAEGGVYLDLDTVTLRHVDDYRARAQVFCGREHIALPHNVAHSRSPRVLAGAGVRLAVRDAMRRLPNGWRLFRKVDGRYHLAANNAVFAAEPGHPFVDELLRGMVEMSPERQLVRFALGTHLLQQTLQAFDGPGVEVHHPDAFYPLPPEISEHWFRPTRTPALGAVLAGDTRIVHWYASVRTKRVVPQIDPAYVRRHARTQLFSAMALPFV